MLVSPSTAFAATYVWKKLLAVAGWPSARFVVGVTPLPESATVSGLPGALLATDSVPVRLPPLVGANLTLTVQEPPAAIELPQVLVWLNGPLVLTEDTEAALLPGWTPSRSARRWLTPRSHHRTTGSTATRSARRVDGIGEGGEHRRGTMSARSPAPLSRRRHCLLLAARS